MKGVSCNPVQCFLVMNSTFDIAVISPLHDL